MSGTTYFGPAINDDGNAVGIAVRMPFDTFTAHGRSIVDLISDILGGNLTHGKRINGTGDAILMYQYGVPRPGDDDMPDRIREVVRYEASRRGISGLGDLQRWRANGEAHDLIKDEPGTVDLDSPHVRGLFSNEPTTIDIDDDATHPYVIMTTNVLFDPKLSDLGFRVLCALKHHARQSGTCFPKVSTIAKEIGKSTTQVREALRHLESRRYVQTVHRPPQSNLYQLRQFKTMEPSSQRRAKR